MAALQLAAAAVARWHGSQAALCHFPLRSLLSLSLFPSLLLVLRVTLSALYAAFDWGFRANSLLITIVDKFPAAAYREMQLQDKCLATKVCK